MRRICMVFVAGALLSLPIFAQSVAPAPACGLKALKSSPSEDLAPRLGYQPLASEQRLFYGLGDLWRDVPVEVRYLVNGQLHLTEVIDLANAKAPRISLDSTGSLLKSATELDFEPLREEARMFELLALRPDLVRQLHEFAGAGDVLTVEIHQDGRLVEILSFAELQDRSTEVGKSAAVPLVVQSTVSGPGDRGGYRISPVTGFEQVLQDCGDCTTSTPCDTECGYDEGKGGPVTCGEYGVCQDECLCSATVSEFWTSWYFLRNYYNGQIACLRSFTVSPPNGAWHNRYVEEHRRDRIRRTYVCPNCPSCDGCYYQEQVIAYEILYLYCWDEGVQICANATTPCCSTLCFVGPFTPCVSSC